LPDLSLRVCGISVGLRSADGRFLDSARRRYAPFVTRSRPDLSIRLELSDRPLRKAMEEPRVRPDGRIERHDLEFARGRAVIVRGLSPLDSLLRIVLSSELARRGGFLCHAAAVDGWLFPGRSGAGKSTLGVSAPQQRLLADELVGVMPGRLWGTPFWGDFRQGRNNGSAAPRAIFFLDRRAPRGVRPLPKARALVRLLECVLFFGDDARSAGKILARARRFVESVPTFVLSYDARTTRFSGVETIIRGARG
jgi:hypothetical protein